MRIVCQHHTGGIVRRAVAACWAAVFVIPLFFGHVALAGSITVKVEGEAKVLKVWAVLRTVSQAGIHSRPFAGRLDGNQIIIDNLDPGGPYDLRIETDRGTLEGWDASVPPPSDPTAPEPIDEESLRTVLVKMTGDQISGFDDEVVVLDIQGHGEHLAVLSTRLRTRPFTESAGRNDTTWVWRVDRWQWENVDGVTWTPWLERPFYALRRERLREPQYKSLRVVLARHLGGLHLTEERPDILMDTIQLPAFTPGIHAIHPDGTRTQELRIKPGGVPRTLKATTPNEPAGVEKP